MTDQQKRGQTMSIAAIVAVIGFAAIVRGIALAWLPGGWIAAGLFVSLPATFIAYSAVREKR